MDVPESKTFRPGDSSMARPRKSKYEKLAEKHKVAVQAANDVAAQRSQIRKEEKDRDTRRKILAGGAAFAHARIDLVWRESFANALDKSGRAMKTERGREEMAAVVEYVKGGCEVVDIDQRIEEILKANENAARSVPPPSAGGPSPGQHSSEPVTASPEPKKPTAAPPHGQKPGSPVR
jgi:hypothetical protein